MYTNDRNTSIMCKYGYILTNDLQCEKNDELMNLEQIIQKRKDLAEFKSLNTNIEDVKITTYSKILTQLKEMLGSYEASGISKENLINIINSNKEFLLETLTFLLLSDNFIDLSIFQSTFSSLNNLLPNLPFDVFMDIINYKFYLKKMVEKDFLKNNYQDDVKNFDKIETLEKAIACCVNADNKKQCLVIYDPYLIFLQESIFLQDSLKNLSITKCENDIFELDMKLNKSIDKTKIIYDFGNKDYNPILNSFTIKFENLGKLLNNDKFSSVKQIYEHIQTMVNQLKAKLIDVGADCCDFNLYEKFESFPRYYFVKSKYFLEIISKKDTCFEETKIKNKCFDKTYFLKNDATADDITKFTKQKFHPQKIFEVNSGFIKKIEIINDTEKIYLKDDSIDLNLVFTIKSGKILGENDSLSSEFVKGKLKVEIKPKLLLLNFERNEVVNEVQVFDLEKNELSHRVYEYKDGFKFKFDSSGIKPLSDESKIFLVGNADNWRIIRLLFNGTRIEYTLSSIDINSKYKINSFTNNVQQIELKKNFKKFLQKPDTLKSSKIMRNVKSVIDSLKYVKDVAVECNYYEFNGSKVIKCNDLNKTSEGEKREVNYESFKFLPKEI